MGLLAIFFFSRTKRKRKISKSAEPLPVTATGSDSFIGKLWRDLGSGFKELKGQYKVRGRRQWHPTPVLLPGKSRGLRSLVGCSPWGHKESDTTGWLTHTHTHTRMSIESMIPSNISSPSSALDPSQYQGLFQWVSSSHQVTKVLELQLQHQSFQWVFSSKRWCVLKGRRAEFKALCHYSLYMYLVTSHLILWA